MIMRKIADVAFLSLCTLIAVSSSTAAIAGISVADAFLQVPEPGTLGIFALGIGALYLIARHKRRK